MWRELSRNFPAVMKEHRQLSFESLAADYETLPKTGLKITAALGSSYAPALDGGIHLDGVLSWAVANSHPCPPIFNRANDAVVFPLPVKLLWVSSDGLPLWASNSLLPAAGAHQSMDYWHKRFSLQRVNDWCEKPNASTGRGQFKEFRVPMRVSMPEDGLLTAYCIGNKAEVERLLSYVHFIGKKPAQGRGAVLGWVVDESNVGLSDVLAGKALPCEYTGETGGTVTAWTPPYWYRPWHASCSRVNDVLHNA